ncbi:MAG: single-stranded-DNA-specific exonuclease RecJ [Halanaerobiales bacterium]
MTVSSTLQKWYIENTEVDYDLENIHPLILKILKKRGLSKKEELEKFFSGSIKDLYDPYLFAGMKSAVSLIKKAVKQKDKIIVYGDYDVDGVTASALLYRYFKTELDYNIDYYLPHRLDEGYGLNLEAVEKISSRYDLMITVDCGITAVEETEYACNRGMEVIITDHHQPADSLPPAAVILDPHLEDCSYPYPDLAGVGVVFKLCQALGGNITRYLELVALGSIADIVPLEDENRLMVKKGLELLNSTRLIGLEKLMAELGLSGRALNAGQVGFILAPPLNAAGRIHDPEKAIQLLITESPRTAEDLASELVSLNRERQKREEEIYQQARDKIKKLDLTRQRCLVLSSPEWHPGIIGIVASRLVERFNLPVVMIAEEGQVGKGSCRSISGINIFTALEHCSDLLENYGGHTMAAGLTINAKKIDDLQDKLNNYLWQHFTGEEFIPGLKLDGVLKPEEITYSLYRDLEKMRPFGAGNPRPKFLLNNVKISDCYQVGNDGKHLKLKLGKGLEGIGFGLGPEKDNVMRNPVDLACAIKENEWQGQKKLELDIKSINMREDCSYYPISFETKNWRIYDKRGCRDRRDYLTKLSKLEKRVAVYLNSRKKRQHCEDLFSKMIFFSATAKTQKIKAEELVLYSLPFTLEDLEKMVLILDSEKPGVIHLLYGEREYYQCRKAINKRLKELDFNDSIRYNKVKNIQEQFNSFARLAYGDDLFELIDKLSLRLKGGKNE